MICTLISTAIVFATGVACGVGLREREVITVQDMEVWAKRVLSAVSATKMNKTP